MESESKAVLARALKESDRGRLSDQMKILSVNVGGPREVEWKGKLIRTSIFKSPQNGSVRVFKLNLEGDKQSDLTVHGGVDKAVYAYPSEHYSFWRQEFPDLEITWGASAKTSPQKDCWRPLFISAILLRSGPRVLSSPSLDCPALNSAYAWGGRISLNGSCAVKGVVSTSQFWKRGRSPGGILIQLLRQDPQKITVADIASLFGRNLRNRELLRTASQLSALSSSLRDEFRSRNQTDAG